MGREPVISGWSHREPGVRWEMYSPVHYLALSFYSLSHLPNGNTLDFLIINCHSLVLLFSLFYFLLGYVINILHHC